MMITRTDLSLSLPVADIEVFELTAMLENSRLREVIAYASSVERYITVVVGVRDLNGRCTGDLCVSLCPSPSNGGDDGLYDQVISETIVLFKQALVQNEMPCAESVAFSTSSRSKKERYASPVKGLCINPGIIISAGFGSLCPWLKLRLFRLSRNCDQIPRPRCCILLLFLHAVTVHGVRRRGWNSTDDSHLG
jgi:hypothetical protein